VPPAGERPPFIVCRDGSPRPAIFAAAQAVGSKLASESSILDRPFQD